jgi:adenine-specific DNA methylase
MPKNFTIKELRTNGDNEVQLVPTIKLLILLVGFIGTVTIFGNSYISTRDNAKKVPALEQRICNMEIETAVDREGNWVILTEIMRNLDPHGAEGRIKQVEAMKRALSEELLKQRRIDEPSN